MGEKDILINANDPHKLGLPVITLSFLIKCSNAVRIRNIHLLFNIKTSLLRIGTQTYHARSCCYGFYS